MIIARSRVVPFYIICLLFILLNAWAVIADADWLSVLPFVFGGFLLLFFNLEKALLLLAFMVPLSVNYDDIGLGLGISLPDEPMIIVLMCLAVFKFIIYSEYDYKVFRHPITIAILINTAWLFVTCISSEMPLISFKFFLSRFWYIIVFYFLGVMLFRRFGNIIRYLWLYMIPLAAIVIYTLIRHQAQNFSKNASYEVMQPFFVAHGVYAAVIAFFIPLLLIYILSPKRLNLNVFTWIFCGAILVLFWYGLVYSYTRAAWLSVVGAAFFLVPLIFRIKLNTLIITAVACTAFFLIFQNEIYYVMSKTQDVSSNDISVHLKSVSNIKSDASNAERINRWVSAVRMFQDRPFLGFGPGTYGFVYAPYQLYQYHTIISTDFGDVGNAHSEFLGPLSESGIFGLLSLLAIIYCVFRVAFRLYYEGKKAKVRLFSLAIMLGLVTYIIHGVMNNYSESDKIAVLWWGSFAMITAMDLYHDPKSRS